MRTKTLALAMMAGAMFLIGGCAGMKPSKNSMSREQFTEEAKVKIGQELQTNSFISNRPYLIVKEQGEKPESTIDDLFIGLRETLINYFLDLPGVFPPISKYRTEPFEKPYQLKELNCEGSQEPEVFIMINIMPLEDKGTVRASIRALDIKKGQLIGGVVKANDKITLTKREVEASGNFSLDTTLRGLKFLPFESGQHADLAAYLASNLSCIFRAEYQGQADKVYVDDSKVGKYKNLTKLIKRQLNLCNEIQLIDQEKDANWVLVPEVLSTGPNSTTWQFWITVRQLDGGLVIKGLSTYAYFIDQAGDDLVGWWEIRENEQRLGYLEIRTDGGRYQADLFGPDGKATRNMGIIVNWRPADRKIDYSYADGAQTLQVDGRVTEDGQRISTRVNVFPRNQYQSWELIRRERN